MKNKSKTKYDFNESTKLSPSDIKNIEVDMLERFLLFCEKEDIKVYIAYGTLLGAVRHNDFIPWDDDIDVIIPRADYDRLILLCKEKKISDSIDFICFENSGWNYPFGKLVRNDTYTNTKDSPYHHGIWVDVFPLDNVRSLNDKVLKQSRRIRATILAKMYKYDHLFTVRGLAKLFIKIFTCLIPIRVFTKKLVKICKQYDNSCQYYSNLSWGYGTKDVFDKKDLDSTTRLTFNRLTVPVVANYKSQLSQIYGDYMILPPVEKRKTHGFDAWYFIEPDHE